MPSTPSKQAYALQMESPLYSGGSSSVAMEAELHEAPSTMLGDYPTIQSYEDLRNLFWIESIKVWSIAGPIAFNILCNYGINSFTNIIVGHLGDVELSGVAISLSVIANFSFGFLVRFSSFPVTPTLSYIVLCFTIIEFSSQIIS